MYPTGKIEITNHYNSLTGGIERRDFKWTGGLFTQISCILFYDSDVLIPQYHKDSPPHVGDVIAVGPFRLKILEIRLWEDTVVAVRINSPLGYLRYYWHRFCKLFDLVYRRLIITAVVWDCASHNPGVNASWKDLYLIQYIQTIYSRLMTYLK